MAAAAASPLDATGTKPRPRHFLIGQLSKSRVYSYAHNATIFWDSVNGDCARPRMIARSPWSRSAKTTLVRALRRISSTDPAYPGRRAMRCHLRLAIAIEQDVRKPRPGKSLEFDAKRPDFRWKSAEPRSTSSLRGSSPNAYRHDRVRAMPDGVGGRGRSSHVRRLHQVPKKRPAAVRSGRANAPAERP